MSIVQSNAVILYSQWRTHPQETDLLAMLCDELEEQGLTDFREGIELTTKSHLNSYFLPESLRLHFSNYEFNTWWTKKDRQLYRAYRGRQYVYRYLPDSHSVQDEFKRHIIPSVLDDKVHENSYASFLFSFLYTRFCRLTDQDRFNLWLWQPPLLESPK